MGAVKLAYLIGRPADSPDPDRVEVAGIRLEVEASDARRMQRSQARDEADPLGLNTLLQP